MTRDRRPGAHLMLVLTATMAVGPLLTHSLSAMSPLVIADLELTEAQFGLLATTTFFVAAVTAVRTGRWADRLAARTLLVVMFGGAALAMLLSAAAPGYAVLLAAMVLSGLGQVMANPATNRLIRLHVPAGRRASWLGIKQAGVQASQLVAGLTFPALGLLLGWRTAVLVAVGAVLLLLVHGWWTVPDNHPGTPVARPSRTTSPSGTASRSRTASRSWAALRSWTGRRTRRPEPTRRPRAAGAAARPPMPGAVRAYAAAAALTGLGAQAANVYLPLYAHRELGFDVVAAGATVSVSALVGIASRVLWARVMDRPGADGFVLLAGMALGAAASAVLLVLAPLHPGLAWAVWPAAVLHGGAALAVSVVVMSAAMRAVPADRVGASTGVVTMGLYAGFCAGPLVLGGLLQLTGSFAVGWGVVLACYLACAALAVLVRSRAHR
ncbi:arabinose ABC transporter permease [Kocuria sp. WN036]|uniref:MFS transporter n=1 Tax=Kocuria sp. WN036 TaxID=2032628 RepID=UPI000BABFF39|nr:MFS transporter [Kocuria sp. WN036]PAU92095.1 arabinose ABC transporter permease [Kocuria sp. WN036]